MRRIFYKFGREKMKKNHIGLKMLFSAVFMLSTVDQSSSMDHIARSLTRAVEEKNTSMIQFLLTKYGAEAASILPQIEHRNFLNQLSRQLVKAVEAKDAATIQSLLAEHGSEAASILSQIEHRIFLNRFKPQLVKAVDSEDITTVRSLVAGHNVDVSIFDTEGANLLRRVVFSVLTGRPYSDPSGNRVNFPESESRRILSELERKRELIKLLAENGAKFGKWFEIILSDMAERCDGADGYLSIIGFLLDCGANVNSVSWCKKSLLHTAVGVPNMELVKFLLARHADFNATEGWCGDTLLHTAVKSRIPDMVRFILGLCPNINAKNKSDQTPLHIAAMTQNLPIIRCLLDNGADINVTDDRGYTPVHWLAVLRSLSPHRRAKTDILVYLVVNRGANVYITDKKGESPLDVALRVGEIEAIKFLMPFFYHLDINAIGSSGETMLTLAARGNDSERIEHLCNLGANVNAFNGEWETPLDIAAQFSIEAIAPLIARGGKLSNAANQGDGETLLTLAIKDVTQHHMLPSFNMIDRLISLGADTNATNSQGETPLDIAVQFSEEFLISTLIAHGGKLSNAANQNGETLLTLAVRDMDPERIELLISIHVETLPPLAAQAKNLERITRMISLGADVNAVNGKGETPLDIAVQFSEESVISTLIAHGGKFSSDLHL
jgi:ankyrin repeat protein